MDEATKPSNKEINSSSLDDESAELESEYPQVREMINNANGLVGSSNTWRPSNWKSPSKSCYLNPQPGQFLLSLLKMVSPKQRRVLVVEKILEHFRFSHKWACMKIVVAWLMLVKYADPCIKIPVVLCNIGQIYEMFIFMSTKDAFVVFFHTLTTECSRFATSTSSFRGMATF